MLWWICFFNYADRQAIFWVFPLLEKEFGLTLEQLGWLGSSFGLVDGVCAPLAGRVVDRVQRKSAILGGLHIWSAICTAPKIDTDPDPAGYDARLSRRCSSADDRSISSW